MSTRHKRLLKLILLGVAATTLAIGGSLYHKHKTAETNAEAKVKDPGEASPDELVENIKAADSDLATNIPLERTPSAKSNQSTHKAITQRSTTPPIKTGEEAKPQDEFFAENILAENPTGAGTPSEPNASLHPPLQLEAALPKSQDIIDDLNKLPPTSAGLPAPPAPPLPPSVASPVTPLEPSLPVVPVPEPSIWQLTLAGLVILRVFLKTMKSG